MVYAFMMKLKKGCEEEYKKRHDNLWPEMKQLIHDNSGSNYSIFLDRETMTLFASIEISDPERWIKGSENEINKKWSEYMADIMEVNEDKSPVSEQLSLMFHLD